MGWHQLWGTRMFDYGKYETLRFLLSNLKYWSEEFRFDGFRFDGVTAMLYTHRGVHWDFLGGQSEFYGEWADTDACGVPDVGESDMPGFPEHGKAVYTVAEGVSGQTGACRPVWHGGLGFDARLSMGPPDKWAKLASEPDFNWTPSRVTEICTGRSSEPAIAYLESHDQCLVGDKTRVAFRLMDAAMYDCMGKPNEDECLAIHPAIERGVALHKMARLLTLGMGGEGWLCFMGNEFAHPEWVDFPREGNGESFHHARRQWSLRGARERKLLPGPRAVRRRPDAHGPGARSAALEPERGAEAGAPRPGRHGGIRVSLRRRRAGRRESAPDGIVPRVRNRKRGGGAVQARAGHGRERVRGVGAAGPGDGGGHRRGSLDFQGTRVRLYLPSRSAQVYALVDEWELPEEEQYAVHTDGDFGGWVDDGYDTGGGGEDAVWW